MKTKLIFTIGHSTRSTREFMKILKAYDVELLVDIRHYPGSRYCPQFGKAKLKGSLKRNKIGYTHLLNLGGRRRALKDSTKNAGWRSAQFRGYADYMQTKEFKDGLKELMDLAKKQNVAIMCSEAVPWRCHRSMVGDALIARGFLVIDIFSEKISRDHKLTSFAEISKNKSVYYPLNEGASMPEKKTVKKAQQKKRQGKAPSTQAGEFVKEEFDHIREGKHGARSPKQAIAIGLSKAKRAGVKIPKKKGAKAPTGKSHIHKNKVSAKRSKAGVERLKKEPKSSADSNVISLQSRKAAKERTAAQRSASAKKAARTRKKNAA